MLGRSRVKTICFQYYVNQNQNNVFITNLGQQGANEYIWICISGTEKLLRETLNLDTSKFEIRGVN